MVDIYIFLHLIFVVKRLKADTLNMKEILQQYASYHLWANQRLIDCILTLTQEQQQRTIPSSFPSLLTTLTHMLNVDIIWWRRMKMLEVTVTPGAAFNGTIEELTTALAEQDKTWESWIQKASPAALEHVFHYQNTKKELFKQPVFQVLLHLFNHGTYHRGQLVTMLNQLGVTQIPPTDFIVWSRR